MNTKTITVADHHVRHRAVPIQRHGKARTPAEHHQQVVQQAQKWVAQTFYGSLLKQMRNSPFKISKFEGGKGGDAYQTMFDQRLADKMASGTGRKLVDSLVRKMEGKNAYQKAARPHLPSTFFGAQS